MGGPPASLLMALGKLGAVLSPKPPGKQPELRLDDIELMPAFNVLTALEEVCLSPPKQASIRRKLSSGHAREERGKLAWNRSCNHIEDKTVKLGASLSRSPLASLLSTQSVLKRVRSTRRWPDQLI